MTIISKLNYPGISDNKDVTDIFDYDNFLDHTQLNNLVTSGTGVIDSRKSKAFLDALLDGYGSNIKLFLDSDVLVSSYSTDQKLLQSAKCFMNIVFNSCFQLSFINTLKKYTCFSNINVTQNLTLGNALIVIFQAQVDWSDMSTIKTQLINLDDRYFTWGSGTAPLGSVFDVKSFKTEIVDNIMTSFYPMIYYFHILSQSKNCNDFMCKRVYVLMKYVFIYYTFMTLFIAIFGNADRVAQFQNDLNVNNTDLSNMKYKIVYVMDAILSLLQDENSLDVSSKNGISSTAQYYNQIKTLSQGNVQGSYWLNDKKNNALLMQNNLTNFTNHEVLSYNKYIKTRNSFIIVSVIMLIVLIIVAGLIMSQSYSLVYIVSGVVMLGLAIYGLVSVVRT